MTCELCGHPMPEGESMFKIHGYSGPCPEPALPRCGNDDGSEVPCERFAGHERRHSALRPAEVVTWE